MRQAPLRMFGAVASGNAPVAESSAMALRKDTLAPKASTPHGDEQRRQSPILRWFADLPNQNGTAKQSQKHARAQPNARTSGSSSPSSATSSPTLPPSPNLSALHEALTEALPKPPPVARLPNNFFSSSRSLARPPPFFDNLTRSTLPTASLSPGLFSNYSDIQVPPLSDPADQSPVVLNSPPRGSSIRSLRRLSLLENERNPPNAEPTGSTTPPTRPASPTGWWWFQAQNKENVDSLLNEEDRADTLQQEQDNLGSKYRTPRNPIVFCHGLLGFDVVSLGPSIAPLQVTHWRGIKEVLEANGAEVLITRVPASNKQPYRPRKGTRREDISSVSWSQRPPVRIILFRNPPCGADPPSTTWEPWSVADLFSGGDRKLSFLLPTAAAYCWTTIVCLLDAPPSLHPRHFQSFRSLECWTELGLTRKSSTSRATMDELCPQVWLTLTRMSVRALLKYWFIIAFFLESLCVQMFFA
ncbi:hypothetical protein HGRIS_010473 [Hohenbuehelia grisea]|uniref:Alpha/beta-hydrolase n=1 Tax=Hohenbuehelia grisea TaxID=104357 RepID=A0ABR3J0K9_9AGAR